VNKTRKECGRFLNEFRFNEALTAVWELISFCDKYIEEKKPWEESKNQREVISDLLSVLKEIAELLKPFLPETSEKIIQQIKTNKSRPLFPRLDKFI